MQNKKSEAYYRFRSEQARGVFPYFESDEIEQIVYDLLDDNLAIEALDVLEQGLKYHPDNEQLVKLKILILIHFMRLEEAHTLFSKYENDGTPATETLQFAFEVVEGRSRSAMRKLQTRLRHNQIASIDYINLIDEMWTEMPDDVKADYLISSQKLITDNSEALARIGAMLMDLKRFEDAIPALEKSLDIDAYDIYTWQDLTRCAFELQYYDRCFDSCEFGIAIDPKNPLLHFVKGFILLSREHNYKEALESLKLCKDFFEGKIDHEEIGIPSNEREAQISMTYDMLGQCYSCLDMIDESIACYEVLVKRMPSHHEAMFDLTQRYLDKGDFPKGLGMINKAIKLKPRDTSYLSLKASILASMHCFDEALDTLDRLIKIKPMSKNFLLAKAELALGTHKYEIADNAFRKLLAMKPKEETTKTLMKEYFLSIGDSDALNEIENL